MVVGAGQLATGVVEGLVEGRRGRPSAVRVANRTFASAEALAARAPGLVSAVQLEDLGRALVGADLVISAVESDELVVTGPMLSAIDRDVLVIDLGMPRTVAHDGPSVDGVTLLDLAHLREVVDLALRDRHDEIAAAGSIVDDEVTRFLETRRARSAAPARDRAARDGWRPFASPSSIVRRRTSRALPDDARAAVDQLTKALVAKLAHDPTVALRESAGTDRGQRLADAARTLFDL